MSARTIAIGDIHGCDVALSVLLDHLAPGGDDTLVLLGDVVDRGPDTRKVIDQLLAIEKTSHVVLVMGNHEEIMLDALAEAESLAGQADAPQQNRWLRWGGQETLDSYGGRPRDVPADHRDFIGRAVPYWQSGGAIFTHASLEPEIALERQSGRWLRWQRLTGLEYPHSSGKQVVCGHSGIETGLPLVRNGWVCLDTLAYRGLWLTALDVESEAIYQAGQNGELRFGVTLSDLA